MIWKCNGRKGVLQPFGDFDAIVDKIFVQARQRMIFQVVPSKAVKANQYQVGLFIVIY